MNEPVFSCFSVSLFYSPLKTVCPITSQSRKIGHFQSQKLSVALPLPALQALASFEPKIKRHSGKHQQQSEERSPGLNDQCVNHQDQRE